MVVTSRMARSVCCGAIQLPAAGSVLVPRKKVFCVLVTLRLRGDHSIFVFLRVATSPAFAVGVFHLDDGDLVLGA
jgi:hypothetical protein